MGYLADSHRDGAIRQAEDRGRTQMAPGLASTGRALAWLALDLLERGQTVAGLVQAE